MSGSTLVTPRSHITLRPADRTRIFGAAQARIGDLRETAASECHADAMAPLIADILDLVVIRQVDSSAMAALRLGRRPLDPDFLRAWEVASQEVQRLLGSSD